MPALSTAAALPRASEERTIAEAASVCGEARAELAVVVVTAASARASGCASAHTAAFGELEQSPKTEPMHVRTRVLRLEAARERAAWRLAARNDVLASRRRRQAG